MDRKKLLHKILGDVFRRKIERLEAAFASASAPFYAEIRNIEKEAKTYQEEVDAEQASGKKATEEDYLYDYGDEFLARKDDATEALLELRKAFTFLIYHQWERLAQHWSKSDQSPNHDELIKNARAAGVPLNEPGLEIIRLTVNTLKHNSVKCGKALHKTRADFFQTAFNPNAVNPITGKPRTLAWSEQVQLSDANVEEFFEIVRASAPI